MNFDSDLNKKSVLVTGAAGCIGAWAIKLLQAIGARPIAYDLSTNRERLDLIMDSANDVAWEAGDITDYDNLSAVINRHNISAIVHLAALQTPFCKADPVNSTRINIMGSINILEAARQHNIARISYASSVASPAMGDNEWMSTLYGAHKVCGEQMADVYWQDWQVPSVGIRPSVVYGPGRDQGMSAATTIAMLAAYANQSYTISFTGPVAYVHVEDTAARFVAAVAQPRTGAPVFDLTGTEIEMSTVLELIQKAYPDSAINARGDKLPFPSDENNEALDDYLNISNCRTFEQGVQDTLASFADAQRRGILDQAMINRLIEKNQ